MTENSAILASYSALVVLGFLLPSLRVFWATGHNPYVLPRTDDVQGYVALAFKIVLIALGVLIAVQVVYPALGQHLGPIAVLDAGGVRTGGWCLLAVAGCVMLAAQWTMGESWRIGIDNDHPTELVTAGLFRLSRNPIFLAMRLGLLGIFLLRPNAIVLGLLVAGDIAMQVQVRLEEDFLRRTHGSTYEAYCRQTRRWI